MYRMYSGMSGEVDRALPDALPASRNFTFFCVLQLNHPSDNLTFFNPSPASQHSCLSRSALLSPRRPSWPQHAMNGTPRLASAFPQTPQTTQRRRKLFETPTQPQRDARNRPSPSKSPAKPPKPQPQNTTPLVPVNLIDAPSQRLYVLAFWLALNAWRLYESFTASDELDSTWLFLKWVAVDGVFLFGLQTMHIPWLEWAFPTTLALFLLHVVFDIFVMFRIPVSIASNCHPCRVLSDDISCRWVYGYPG